MKKKIILIINFFKFLKINTICNEYIFYSENIFYKNYYYDFFKSLLQTSKKTFLFTSDIKEYLYFKEKYQNNVLYIGDGFIKILILNFVKCNFLLTTMVGFGNVIKKSPFCKNYIYFFHALASTHKIYKDNSFDQFDIILTNGDYQKKELEKRFEIKKIFNKKIFNSGYFYLDLLKENSNCNDEDFILFAPSWNYDKKNLFNDYGIDIINLLLSNNLKIILRPHPEILKRDKKIYEKTVNTFAKNKNFYVDNGPSNIASLKKSNVIITDNSSIGLEFGIAFLKPTIYINYKEKVHNSEFELIQAQPIEEQFKKEFGYALNICDLHILIKIVKECKKLDRNKINNFVNIKLSNYGNSVSEATKFIKNIII